MTGDNATSNDTQTTSMSELDTNAFKEENRVRCFTHTLNLACRSILKPFSAREKKKKGADTGDGDAEGDTDSIPDLESDTVSFDGAFTDGEGEAEEEEEEEAEDVDGDEGTMAQDEDEDVGLDGELDGEEFETFDEETKEVKKSLDKVCAGAQVNLLLTTRQIRKLSFAIIHSTTILLPGPYDSPRRPHTLELDLRHALLCTELSCCHRCDH